MTTWTREHDAVIARECEGLAFDATDYTYESKPSAETGDVVWLPIPHYSTDLAACFRAAEAWRKRLNVFLQITISTGQSGNTKASVNVVGNRGLSIDGETEREPMSPSQALAWALYNAVKGTK